MKTLFIVYYRLDLGGIQTKIIDIINYLGIHRKNIHIKLILRHKHVGDRINEITNPNVQILYYQDTIWSRLPFFFPIYIIGLTYYSSPQSILAFTFIPVICSVLSKKFYFFKSISVVASEDWSESDELSGDLNGNFPYLRKLTFRWLYHRADAICSVNPYISDVLIRKYKIPASKIVHVSNWFRPSHQKSNNNLETNTDIIYVGRLEKIKNLLFLLTCVKKIVKQNIRFTCLIVGTGSEFGLLKSYVFKNNLGKNVQFTGFSHDPGKYLVNSKIFTLTSTNEGLPISLLDAMANKLPAVCMYYKGIQKIITHGVNGYVCHSKKEFTDHVLFLLNHPRRRIRMGRQGYVHVTRYYSQSNIETYLQLLHV